MLPLFTLTIFLGAALLFLIQPLVAKLLLPQLGGSPTVWNTSLVFFQVALLLGYLYADRLPRVARHRTQVIVHATLLVAAAALLPIRLPQLAPRLMESAPAGWLILTLGAGIGLPFVLVSTGASLLQRWFASTAHPAARDPYFLYAASNAGSLVGLLAYPLLVEPALSLASQRLLWSAGYIVWGLLVMACGALTHPARSGSPDPQAIVPRAESQTHAPRASRPGSSRLHWTLLSLAPSSLLLGVTLFISTDLAAVPLLWVIPLSLYLVTFIVAFSPRLSLLIDVARGLFLLAAIVLALTWLVGIRLPLPASLNLHLSLLFFGGVACHGLLARSRPEPSRLTEFYLFISIGGALGGTLTALVAPLVFSFVAEYPLAIGLGAALVMPLPAPPSPPARAGIRVSIAGLLAAALIVPLLGAGKDVSVLARRRTFFGVHRILATPDHWHILMHGVTIHGRQNFDANNRFFPTGYYHPTGPLGQVMQLRKDQGGWHDAAIVGLGAGSLAAYGHPSEHITFFEIDPAVIQLASTPEYFTFLSDSKATIATVLGDARISLASEPEHRFDAIVLDAFSSDAIPVHLLTREALSLYLTKLSDHGVLALHLSNRYLDLPPIVAAAARDLGLSAFVRYDDATPQQRAEGKSPSTVAVLARSASDLGAIPTDPRWRPLLPAPGSRAWTDDYSNVISVMRFF